MVAKTYLLLGGYCTTIKSLLADLSRQVIRPGETFQQKTLFHGSLDALLLLWPNMRRSVPEMCYIFANILQTLTSILNLTVCSESQ